MAHGRNGQHPCGVARSAFLRVVKRLCAQRLAVIAMAALLALVVGACSSSAAGQRRTLLVAAASDLQPALGEIAAQFERETGIPVTLSFGSTGQLTQQIENGAPFDVFAVAHVRYLDRLEAQGLLAPETRRMLAEGRLALVAREDRGGRVARLEDLADPSIRPIAIANPEHAPYGLAARQALETVGLWDAVQSRLVMGENVQQALQFVQTGDAMVGLVALSNAARADAGLAVAVVPPSLHEPIVQGVAMLASSSHQAEAMQFIDFVTGPTGREILLRYGFVVPEVSP